MTDLSTGPTLQLSTSENLTAQRVQTTRARWRVRNAAVISYMRISISALQTQEGQHWAASLGLAFSEPGAPPWVTAAEDDPCAYPSRTLLCSPGGEGLAGALR